MGDVKLLPCPFDGGDAVIGGYPYDHASQFMVECSTCHCAVGKEYDRDAMPDFQFGNEESAIAAWNTRATPSLTPTQAAADELFEALEGAEWADNGRCPQCGQSGPPHQPECILANALAKAGQP